MAGVSDFGWSESSALGLKGSLVLDEGLRVQSFVVQMEGLGITGEQETAGR